MNSVFSAFKTSKSSSNNQQQQQQQQIDKNLKLSNPNSNLNNSTNNSLNGILNNSCSTSNSNINNSNSNIISSSKKSILNNSNENSYENLRHIREIGTNTKIMTSILVNDDVEDDLCLHNRTIIKSVENIDDDLSNDYHQSIPKNSSTQLKLINNIDIDETDNIIELDSSNLEMKLEEMKNEITQKRNLLNGCNNNLNLNLNLNLNNNLNSNSNCLNTNNLIYSNNTSMSTSSSSSSDNTIVLSTDKLQIDEIKEPPPPKNSPAKSLTSYNNINNAIASTSSLNDCFNGTFTTISSTLCTGKPPNSTIPIIMGNKKQQQNNCGTNSGTTTPKSNRFNKPRLSLSGFNNSLPSIHGRPNSAGNAGQQNGTQTKRLSNHQRNLSLDFRSMGILLPPVSQVTNTRINLTQHHRNRSLDSALQRIPEVEVSSPNAETAGQTIENTFCTNSLNTMCSTKITNIDNIENVMPSISDTDTINTPTSTSVSITLVPQFKSILTTNSLDYKQQQEQQQQKQQEEEQQPQEQQQSKQQQQPSQQSQQLQQPQQYQRQPKLQLNTSSASENKEPKSIDQNRPIKIEPINNSKKREDLTSLGSDDSGIICGSESDQVSLNRIRHSHESLDSGEMDQDDQECIEILETTSMDEEYRMLQSDLCFYQVPEKDLRTLTRNRQRKIAPRETCEEDENNYNCNDEQTTPVTPQQELCSSSSNSTTKSQELSKESKSENIKNENNSFNKFNFFGATKNAIFRTAQSIIENHEKKNAAKSRCITEEVSSSSSQDDVQQQQNIKSPTEFTKKKEFFMLKSCSNRNKNQTKTEIKSDGKNETETAQSPELETKALQKSHSISSINKLKVPGVVKCFIKSIPTENLLSPTASEQLTSINKTEKGQSGLLRFFESPVFNIHFAVHYLFYSKEPGVLSFIGNKIFSFPDLEVDLYIPQLIVMYIQMDELAEVLDPYLTIRCRKSVDFSLKCLWLLEAYNYQFETGGIAKHLSLMKELYSKKERKSLKQIPVEIATPATEILSPIKKTHHRSQSDATGLLGRSATSPLSLSAKIFTPASQSKLSLGDLTSGRAFDNGCTCFESVRGTVNDLLGQKTVCSCGAPKTAPQKEFMKALINIGKNLTVLQTKAEKTSALRMFLNLINKNLPARVWLPLHSDIPHHIVRITEEKTAVLNSKDKTPYIIYIEVVEVSDIYSSPVIMKMMPSLRHTKSEEHLDSKEVVCTHPHHNHVVKKISDSSSISETEDTKIENKPQPQQQQQQQLQQQPQSQSQHPMSNLMEEDAWSQEDDEITAQYLNLKHKLNNERDTISQMSMDSYDSKDQGIPTLFNIGDVRNRHCTNLSCENTKPFSHDPEDPSAAALKEPWHEKERQIRESSPYGHLSNWRLLSAIVKCGDDLRQELMATQLLEMFKLIWEEEHVDLWVRPYKIVCLSDDSGLIEPILNTVSLHQIKKNSNKSLRDYFIDEYGGLDNEHFQAAQKNFVQSCAAYCLISYLLQVKDRHNGNILLHCDGHLIHIDFGFILSISPKNLGFEQSPFKLTPEFVDVMGGTQSEHWTEFNHLLLKGLMAARKHMDRIINLVEIMRSNAQLPCFKNGCSGTVQNLRKRFHMNLTEQELERKVDQLVQDSLKSLSTKLYDGYQYFTNGIL